jgi:hypothetical protein
MMYFLFFVAIAIPAFAYRNLHLRIEKLEGNKPGGFQTDSVNTFPPPPIKACPPKKKRTVTPSPKKIGY